MKTYSITYDLGNPGRAYGSVAEAIRQIANGYCRPTESQWIVNSSLSASEIRDVIGDNLDNGDKLFINEVGDDWASWGLSTSTIDWLHKYWRSSSSVS
ncbi:MAG: hypothetical protein M9945_01360 [Aquamicrobium sp.]|uniref:hypothetical protein n=1 Tax=Aquamicrobium sp. TaxID=1872579 RepID=UPI00349E51D4|nr:hypothetical protein [Aquamicrobium sp.]